MNKSLRKFREYFGIEHGQGVVEYVLLVAFIAIVLIAAFMMLSGSVENSYNVTTEVHDNLT